MQKFPFLEVVIDRKKDGYLRARVVQRQCIGTVRGAPVYNCFYGADILQKPPRRWVTCVESAYSDVIAKMSSKACEIDVSTDFHGTRSKSAAA